MLEEIDPARHGHCDGRHGPKQHSGIILRTVVLNRKLDCEGGSYSQRQQQKKIKEMLANLKKNDEVVTTSGIHGTVAIIKERTVVLRVDEGCRIEFDRESIASVISTEVKPEVVK